VVVQEAVEVLLEAGDPLVQVDEVLQEAEGHSDHSVEVGVPPEEVLVEASLVDGEVQEVLLGDAVDSSRLWSLAFPSFSPSMVQALDGGQYPAKKVQPGWMREFVVTMRRENLWKTCQVWSFTNNVSVFTHVSPPILFPLYFIARDLDSLCVAVRGVVVAQRGKEASTDSKPDDVL
jgi:hypothetical protein